MTKDYIEKLDKELENQIKMVSAITDPEAKAKVIKNLEVLSAIRTDIYQKQSDSYAAKAKVIQDDKKLEQDAEKIAADKKQFKSTTILNGVIAGISAVGSIGVPIWIMTAERRGQFWSNRALNATEKPPKISLIKLPFKK